MKKAFRKILSVLAAVGVGFSALSGFGVSEAAAADDITDKILARFAELTQIPRPSKHEQQVSDYLYSWAEKKP